MTQAFNALLLACRYMLTALGVSLIFRVTGCIDFSQASMYLLGAYLAYIYSTISGFPLFVAVPLAVLTTSALGFSVDVLIYRPLRRNDNAMLAVLLASLGVAAVIQNTVSLIFQNVTYSLSGLPDAAWTAFGVRIALNHVVIISAVTLLAISLQIVRRRSRLALAVEAVASNRTLAFVMGIRTEQTIARTAFIGSGLSALAGALVSLEAEIQPGMGADALLTGMLIALLTGGGEIRATILASCLVAALETVSAVHVSLLWRQTIAFMGVLLVMHLRWMRGRQLNTIA